MKKLTITEIAELPQHDLNSYLGISGHFGGIKATRSLIDLTKIKEGQKILDVGCGLGDACKFIAKRYDCNVIGVDISKIGIEKAYNKKAQYKKKLEFFIADIQNLPIKNESFDVIISENVITLVKSKKKALEELARVTKPGGYIGCNEIYWLKKPENLSYDKDTGEIKEESEIYKTKIYVFPTFHELLDLIKKIGFNEVAHHKIPKTKMSDKMKGIGKKFKNLRIFFKIISLSARNKELKNRFIMASKHQSQINKGNNAGFGLFICKK